MIGYTDPSGTEPLNHLLELQRARSVAAALTKDLHNLGVTSVSIHTSGAGVSHVRQRRLGPKGNGHLVIHFWGWQAGRGSSVRANQESAANTRQCCGRP